jgi:tetratricopeptide (TPR) repeat protein
MSKKRRKKRKKKSKKKTRKSFSFLTLLLVLGISSFVAFSPAFDADFVYWDDDVNVYENPNVQSLTAENVKKIFTEDVIGNYNPLPILSFAIEKALFGLTPFYYHLNNIILHFLSCILVFYIGFKMGLNRWAALLLSLLFAVHPMRVESVVWITERKDVLFGLFYWAALLFYIIHKKENKRSYYWYALLIFPLALLSKIQAVALPLSMICVDYFLDKKFNWKQVISKWPFFILSLITGLGGIYFLAEAGSLEQEATKDVFNFGERIVIGAYSYLIYLYKLIVPYPMAPLYPYPSGLTWVHYTVAALILPYIGIAYWLWRNKYFAWVFGILFFTVNVIFLLQVVGAGQGYLADRFTYIGYFGFFFVAAYYFEKYKGLKSTSVSLITAAVLLVYLFLTYQQSKIWENSETMWSKVIQHNPKTPLPFRNRGNYFRDNNMAEKALKDYSEALRLEPDQDEAYNSRGRLYFQKGELQKALNDYNKALEYNPDKAEYYSNRGATYARLNQYERALQDFNKAVQLNPSHVSTYLNRAILYDVSGQAIKAMNDLDTYLKYRPNQHDLWYNLGLFAAKANQNQKALDALNKAIRLKGDVGSYYKLRAKVHLTLGNKSQAQRDARLATTYGDPLGPSWQEKLGQ